MLQQSRIAVWASIGAALRFVRENWRFVLSVAGLGAVAHGLAMAALGSNILLLPALIVISAAIHAVLTRAALSGAGAVRQAASGDALRTIAAMAIVGLFAALVGIVVFYIAASVLIAPYGDAVKAAGQDEAALRALMERAVAEQPNLLRWAGAVGALLIFALTSRFYFAAPASIERARILVFASWALSRGRLLRIMLARLVLLAPALILAAALQALLGLATGIGAGDPVAMLTRAQSSPAGFLAFYVGAQFLQIAVYSSLEAGLSAHLYRNLSPPPKP